MSCETHTAEYDFSCDSCNEDFEESEYYERALLDHQVKPCEACARGNCPYDYGD